MLQMNREKVDLIIIITWSEQDGQAPLLLFAGLDVQVFLLLL